VQHELLYELFLQSDHGLTAYCQEEDKTMSDMKPISPLARLAKQEAKEFRLIFAACFVIFLMVVIMARLLPKQWRPWPAAAQGRTSIINEAKAATNTFIPFAFMA
jgi:hypothetical protein